MRTLMGLTLGWLVVCLSVTAVGPAFAADTMSMTMDGAMLPFFNDPAAGNLTIFEIISPVVPTSIGVSLAPDAATGSADPAPGFTNPLHIVFFRENCARSISVADLETSKQAKAVIGSASPLLLNFNGLAAIASSIQGNDLLPLNFPLHVRSNWIDTRAGRLRGMEGVILNTFLSLGTEAPLVENPGAGSSLGLCAPGAPPFTGINNDFCWSPLRSAATFVTPQESASLKATIYLICPTADIQSAAGTGVFPIAAGFPRLQNRDGTFGFPARSVITGNNVTTLRGRIYDGDEDLVRDILVPCACLTVTPILSIDAVYTLPPANLGAHTVPVWYTELEVQSATSNPITPNPQQFSFTGYWGLEVVGREGALFHRMSNASLDNLSFGTANPFANR